MPQIGAGVIDVRELIDFVIAVGRTDKCHAKRKKLRTPDRGACVRKLSKSMRLDSADNLSY
jgi:hypothetical protein